jgi:hypothetical protein
MIIKGTRPVGGLRADRLPASPISLLGAAPVAESGVDSFDEMGTMAGMNTVVGATDAAGEADCKSGNGAAVAQRVSAESGLTPCVRDTGFAPRGWVGSRVGIRPPQCP